MTKKISILMFSLCILFASYSCEKKGGLNPTDKISFSFEIEGSGVLELSVTNSRGVSLYNYTVENAVEKVEIEEAVIKGNTLVAKANAGKGYVFDAWDGVTDTIGDAVIVPESSADATIKVSFIQNPYNGSQAAINPESETDYDAGDGWIWVYKPEHIKWISANVSAANSKKYKFKNDISFNGKDHTSIGSFMITRFSGKIDGNGKSFKEAKIVANNGYAGFIGEWHNGGEIKNLTIDKSVEINASYSYVGGIAGRVHDGGPSIINCVNNANINNSSTSTYSITGGIVGAWHGSMGIIENCYNAGNITAAGGNVGGILGKYENPASGVPMAIKKSYNIGNITLNSTSGSSGGIAGLTFNVSDSYNIGTVKGGAFSGGIVGSTDIDTYSAPLVLENVYSTTVPTVYSGNAIGGIVGNVKVTGSSLTKSYFVKGSSSVQNDGYSATSTQTGDGVNRTKTISDLATLHNEFGTTVWGTKDGRPVIKGLGEGK